ncbi:hypothetical protein [Dactylosporangium sp. NPDC049140]|uniref:hypothetical protein n=1 Tax=Dactylosporangium sp. NPDC049140 TaxID=3155647 RepID=UPI0033EE77E3
MGQSAPDRIAAYLDEVTGALPAGRRTRAAIRAELADGLACAVEARLTRSTAPAAPTAVAEATAAALAEFGAPAVVARAFAGELLIESAQRTGLGLLCGGPLAGLLWVLAAPVTGSSWPDRVYAALTAVPAYPVVLALVVPAAAVSVAAGRRFGHRLHRLGAVTAQFAVAGCVAGDVLLLAAVAGTGPAGWATSAAATASGLRLIAAAVAWRRLARLRAAAA